MHMGGSCEFQWYVHVLVMCMASGVCTWGGGHVSLVVCACSDHLRVMVMGTLEWECPFNSGHIIICKHTTGLQCLTTSEEDPKFLTLWPYAY